jgi:hypothetical protein
VCFFNIKSFSLSNLILSPEETPASLHHNSRQNYQIPVTQLGQKCSRPYSSTPLYAFCPRNFRALHLLAPTTNGTLGTSKSNFIKKVLLFVFHHSYRHTSAHTNLISLAALQQQHNSNSQPCPAENQTFQPSQMATRNHQHPQVVKCVRDQV